MSKINIDFEIEVDEGQQPPQQHPLQSIKAGAPVCIRYAPAAQPEAAAQQEEAAHAEPQQPVAEQAQVPLEPCTAAPSGRVCMDGSGQHLLGAVPESARKRLASFGEELQGSVRSIKRDEAGRPRHLLVRIQVVNGQPVMQGGALYNLGYNCAEY